MAINYPTTGGPAPALPVTAEGFQFQQQFNPLANARDPDEMVQSSLEAMLNPNSSIYPECTATRCRVCSTTRWYQ